MATNKKKSAVAKVAKPQGVGAVVAATPEAELPKYSEIEPELAHIKLMKEENIEQKDLPATFTSMFSNFSTQRERYKARPTEGMLQAVKRTSLTLADAIQSWIETKGDVPTPAPVTPEPVKTPGAAAPTVEPKTKKPDEPFEIKGTWTKEAKEKFNKDGRIYVDDLKKIVNRASLPDRFVFDGVSLERSVAYYYKTK